MKKLIVILLLVCAQAQAQYTFKTVVDTPNPPKINVLIGDLGINSNINQLATLLAFDKSENSFAFYANGKELFQNPDISVKTRFQNQNIQVEISGLSKYELVLLQNTKSNVYLSPKSDIILTLNGGTTATIEKADLETQSLGKISIDKSIMDMYFSAFGGDYAYANNSFNWSFTPKSESDIDNMELNADFSFHQSYSLGSGKAKKSDAEFYKREQEKEKAQEKQMKNLMQNPLCFTQREELAQMLKIRSTTFMCTLSTSIFLEKVTLK